MRSRGSLWVASGGSGGRDCLGLIGFRLTRSLEAGTALGGLVATATTVICKLAISMKTGNKGNSISMTKREQGAPSSSALQQLGADDSLYAEHMARYNNSLILIVRLLSAALVADSRHPMAGNH